MDVKPPSTSECAKGAAGDANSSGSTAPPTLPPNPDGAGSPPSAVTSSAEKAPTSAPAPTNPSPHAAASAPPAMNTLATGITGTQEDAPQSGIDEQSGNGAAPPSKSAPNASLKDPTTSASNMAEEQEESELDGLQEDSSLHHCIANLDGYLLAIDENTKDDCVLEQSTKEDRLIKRKKTDDECAMKAKTSKSCREEVFNSNDNAMEIDGHIEAQAAAEHASSSTPNTSDSSLQEPSSSNDSSLNHCIMNLEQLKRRQTGDEEASKSNIDAMEVSSHESEEAVQREPSSASNALNPSSRQESPSPQAEASNRHEWSVEELDEDAALEPFRRSLSPIDDASDGRLTGFDIPEGFHCDLEDFTVNGKKVLKTPPTSPSCSIASSTSSNRSPETIIRRLRIMVAEEADRPYDYGQIYRVDNRRPSLSDIREDTEPEEEVDNGWFEAMTEEEDEVVDAMEIDEDVSETGDESDEYETADEGSDEESDDGLDGIDFDDTEDFQIDGSGNDEEAVEEHDQSEKKVDENGDRDEGSDEESDHGMDEIDFDDTEDFQIDDSSKPEEDAKSLQEAVNEQNEAEMEVDKNQNRDESQAASNVESVDGDVEMGIDDEVHDGTGTAKKRQANRPSSPVSPPKNPRLEKDNEKAPEEKEKEDPNAIDESKNVSEEIESATVDETPAATVGQVEVELDSAEEKIDQSATKSAESADESVKSAESAKECDEEKGETKKGEKVDGKETDSNEQVQPTSNSVEITTEPQGNPAQTTAIIVPTVGEPIEVPTNPEDAPSHHETRSRRVRPTRQLTKCWRAIQERINEQNAQNGNTDAETPVAETSVPSPTPNSEPKAPSREPSPPAIDQAMPQSSDDSRNVAVEPESEDKDQSEVPPHASTIEADSIDRRQAGTNESTVMPPNPAGAPSPRTSTPSKPRRPLTLIQEGVRKVIREQQARIKELKKNLGSQWPSPKTILGAAPTQPTKLRTIARLEEFLARIDEQGRLNRNLESPSQHDSNDDAQSTVSVVGGIQSQLETTHRIQPTTEGQQASVPTASTTAVISETPPSEPIEAEVPNVAVDCAASPDIHSIAGPNGYVPERLYNPGPMYIGAENVESESNRSENGNETDDSFLHFLRDESMRSANSSPARSTQSDSDSESVNLSSFDAMIDSIVSTLRDMERNPENQERIRKMANLLEKTGMQRWSPNHMEYVRHECPICNQRCHQRPFISDDEASESECDHISRPTTPPPTTPMPAEDIEEPVAADVPSQTPKSPPSMPEPTKDVTETREPAVEDVSMFSDDGIIEDGINGATDGLEIDDEDFEPFQLEDFEDDSAINRPDVMSETSQTPAETRDVPEDSAADGNEEPMDAENNETVQNVPPQSPISSPESPKSTSAPADDNINVREPSEVSFMESEDAIEPENGANDSLDGSNSIVPMNDSDFEAVNLSDYEEDMVIDEPELTPVSTPERPPTPRPPTPLSRTPSPVRQPTRRQPTPLSRSTSPEAHLCGPHCRCPRMYGPPKNRRPARPAPYRRANPRQDRHPLPPRDRAPRRRQTDPEFGRLDHIRTLAGANLPDAPPVVDAEQTAVVDGIHLDVANQVSLVRGEHFEAALYRSGVVVARGYFEGGSTAAMSIRNARNQPITLFNQPDDPATSIAGGPNHLIILTRSGHIYTIGRAIEGQLGVVAYNLERYRQSSISPAAMLRQVFDEGREVLFTEVRTDGNVTIAIDRRDAVEWICGEGIGPHFTKMP